jgi:hypothetical protein
MARGPDSAVPSTRHASQLLALAIGAIDILVGLLGFLLTTPWPVPCTTSVWPPGSVAR